ncbi:MAG: primosomal protein N' [Cyclobacteriaceae bacterium]|nr:MAG: primosomal protein N' [Cyclobacteriaceae bacterium]
MASLPIELVSKLTTHTNPERKSTSLFADVLLPVPVPQNYTYNVPLDWHSLIQVGQRVIVQFGQKKIYTGVVVNVHDNPPETHLAKDILDILDRHPVINKQQLALFDWMARYYMCAEGQVLQVALPSGLKLSSQSKIQLHPEFQQESCPYPIDDRELLLLEALKRDGPIDYSAAAGVLGSKNIHKILKSLLIKNAILLYEEIREKYQPKKERRVRLQSSFNSAKAIEQLFDDLRKQPKQTAVVLQYLQQVQVLTDPELNDSGISKTRLLTGDTSSSSLKTLVRNKVLEEFEVIVSRFETTTDKNSRKIDITLTPRQIIARDQILESFQNSETTLFHGITGSGKTLIYIDLIKQVIDSGSQVLYLLPEIALTTQIVSRLQKVFGDNMGVYHSRFSDNERVEVWQGIIDGRFNFIVGVRSAIFLPFDNLGLIIVDEEHEISYKQFDPAPRYHARDVALVLARLHHAKALLGSATPSIESFYHARSGKYALVSLDHRYQEVALPVYKLVDITKERLKKKMTGMFTQELLDGLKNILSNQQQAIVFQNRRGYAPFLQCQVCGHTPQCPNCAVTLTFHLHYNQLRCHYCGYKQKMTGNCVQCESTDVQLVGFGTEKIEEDLRSIFPEARIQRMDLDTTRRKYSYQEIIDRFEDGGIDILIGTQMVSKGLDFGKVDLVGVLDIDRMMHFPDFRSHERAFQLITQVGGRAGRQSGKGLVLVQTSSVGHQLLRLIGNHDYHGFYLQEISEREKYFYPPFIRFIRLTIKSPDQELGFRAAHQLANKLVRGMGKDRILGPQEPVISKLRNLYLMELYVKLEKGVSINKIKGLVAREIADLTTAGEYRSIRIVPDVDPY